MSALILPEKALLFGGALVSIVEIGLVVTMGGIGASVAMILFTRFAEKRDFGQIQK